MRRIFTPDNIRSEERPQPPKPDSKAKPSCAQIAHFTPEDLYFFSEGRNHGIYEKMGAHVCEGGVHFSVWAPNARAVYVMGDFNGWNRESHPLSCVGHAGIWSGLVAEARPGQCYKYYIHSHHQDRKLEKADPLAFAAESAPCTASVIATLDYQWGDQQWMQDRHQKQGLNNPVSIYELHAGSWRRKVEDNNRPLSYRELADELVPYLQETGFTHVELMPIMEHPFGGSWGYQITGYFAPTSRYGSPQDFMYLIDRLHQAGIGVILDWVPSHFPGDEHGLREFDGTHLYEHADPRQGYHPDWSSYIYNYGRKEVRSFLISNAMFWLDKYHIDGLRVDAVASMLYLDYSRKDGEWIPNKHGGKENLEAMQFLKELNEIVYHRYPDVQMIAEESTAWPGVTKPTYMNGLGFGLKWDMGWMHDTLRYFSRETVHRKYHQEDLTFRSIYAHHENFVLALSHDEVVHGKKSLLGRMSGDDSQKFANMRTLFTYMMTQPGKKLMFMGAELASWQEWNHDSSLDWHLLQYEPHRQMKKLVSDLNHVYRNEAALHIDCDPSGFYYIDASDHDQSVLLYMRQNEAARQYMLCAFNMTPVYRPEYRVGVPLPGTWQPIFNSDDPYYGGHSVLEPVKTTSDSWHGRPYSINLKLPPLSGVLLKWMG